HLATVLAPGDLLVASSDFTHWGQGYGYQGPPGREFGPEEAPERLPALLEEAWAALSSRDPARLWAHQRDTGDTVCGFLPLVILLHALPADAGTHLRRMDSSGALTGDWSRSVSYLAAEFTGLWPYAGVGVSPGLTPAEGEALLKLARGTVEAWVRDRRRPTPEDLGVTLTDRLRADSGVFVTLKKGEALRGCIGTIPPAAPLAEGVLEHAVNASTRDHRFPPVQPGELPELTVEVSVLTPPRVVAGPGDIVLGKHGIWITKQGRSAVFLPQVAPEQGWTLEETLEHLCRKAGLAPDDWKAGMTFEVMEAIVVSEPHP
ncbi:MAG: AmmeMemoRadiSam system protein A, partial [Deltaproteobacteria bacterium]|nr:AmmeMemoRadiSam system protein A [Deltaproteobacteria bacterium]